MPNEAIIANAIKCRLCGDIIESTERNDRILCKCGTCSVSGGHDYLRRECKESSSFLDLSLLKTVACKKVTIYCRVVARGTVEEQNSAVNTQRKYLEEYAMEQHMTVVNCYIDCGFSGYDRNRPALLRMERAYEQGSFDMVLVTNRDVLSNDREFPWHFPVSGIKVN